MSCETCCRVLSIQSHVVSGYVGNKSATFPLQVLGCDVDAINSVQFSNHTGYQIFKGQVLSSSELANIYEGLKANGLNKYSHILTGYISSAALLNEVRQIVLDLRQRNPNTVYVCDPVMGDHGQLYIPKELLPVYCDSIIPLANIITPNQFEAELLTGIKITDVSTAKSALKRLHEMGVKTVVISSTDFGTKDKLVQFASKVTADGGFEAFRIDIPYFDAEFTGTGDLFAALLLAWNHKYPNNFKLACETVVSTMHAVLQRTVEWSRAHTAPGTAPSMAHRELRLVQSKSDIECPKLCVEAVPLTLESSVPKPPSDSGDLRG